MGDYALRSAFARDDQARRDLRLVLAWCAAVILVLLIAGTVFLGMIAASVLSFARDDGKFASSPLKAWFDSLASGKGLCCSFADGVSIEDVDWDTSSVADAGGEAHVVYRVRLNKQWIVVPPKAVVAEPNKFGPAVVWPYQDMNGATQIRCFIPGAGA